MEWWLNHVGQMAQSVQDYSNEIKKIENQVYDLAFDIEMDTGVDISPIIKNEEQYEYWLDTLPFYKNIHEEGVIVNG